jgi:hypothetical protein
LIGSDDDDAHGRFWRASIDGLPKPGSAATRRHVERVTDVVAIICTVSVRGTQLPFDGSH